MRDTIPSVSTSGAPTIAFEFAGETCTAELAGAQLRAEVRSDGRCDLRLTDAAGEVLADLVVNDRSHRNMTENVMDIGSALLWSHWRYVGSVKASVCAAEVDLGEQGFTCTLPVGHTGEHQ